MLPLIEDRDPFERAVSPLREIGAYESLWLEKGAGFKSIADRFRHDPSALPSDFVSAEVAYEAAHKVTRIFKNSGIENFGIRVRGAGEYPKRLLDADHPIELLYYQGWWDLVNTPCVAVVGSRKATPHGIKRTQQLVTGLVEAGFTIVSGLAEGIDRAAHDAAIKAGGQTISVLGTPLHNNYPKANAELQKLIAEKYLVISQVPVLRYGLGNPRSNRFFFPARNITMSALTSATVIVEASDTSGTMHQARAALKQGRKLFILKSCLENKEISWPTKFLKRGAVLVQSVSDVTGNLDDKIRPATANRRTNPL
ncbi:MAG: DNA-processing protein DprA [Alphaproteobacteria bacterium]|nr:DNA-processing protein DprA [Alphaproteobacteria bacterium]